MNISDRLDASMRRNLEQIARLPDDPRDECCIACTAPKTTCEARRRVQRRACCSRCFHDLGLQP